MRRGLSVGMITVRWCPCGFHVYYVISRHRQGRSRGMLETGLIRIVESGTFEWPWSTALGLVVVRGAAGGGGGGGGAFCIEGLNLYGSRGGGGGGGGIATTVTIQEKTHQAVGGNGGGGGDGGGFVDGQPKNGKNGLGSHYGDGGEGGQGAAVPVNPGRTVSNGGNGGKGLPGETILVEPRDLSVGDPFQITVGDGGGGGRGGEGYERGSMGGTGAGGSVIFIPIFEERGDV